MKAHTVTYSLFTHILDHVVNGNTLIFIKIFVLPLLLVTFLIIIPEGPGIFENMGIDF
jgi:hypothetical protein